MVVYKLYDNWRLIVCVKCIKGWTVHQAVNKEDVSSPQDMNKNIQKLCGQYVYHK